MYTIRRITESGVEMNKSLGDSYTLVHRAYNYKEFSKVYERIYGKCHVADLDETADDESKNCFAFVTGEGGAYVQPLYCTQRNYIMSSDGKTFDRIKY